MFEVILRDSIRQTRVSRLCSNYFKFATSNSKSRLLVTDDSTSKSLSTTMQIDRIFLLANGENRSGVISDQLVVGDRSRFVSQNKFNVYEHGDNSESVGKNVVFALGSGQPVVEMSETKLICYLSLFEEERAGGGSCEEEDLLFLYLLSLLIDSYPPYFIFSDRGSPCFINKSLADVFHLPGEPQWFSFDRFISFWATSGFPPYQIVACNRISSTNDLAQHLGINRSVVIANEQASGTGRAGNRWESETGCLMFSLYFEHLLHSSLLAACPNWFQVLLPLALIKTCETLFGDKLGIGLKWPNDIYYSGKKLGGVMVKSVLCGDQMSLVIGCGVNLTNEVDAAEARINLTDILKLEGKDADLDSVQFFASLLSEFENIREKFERNGREAFKVDYYKNWLHNRQKVKVTRNGKAIMGEIIGVDDYCYLLVRLEENGEIVETMPDGNRFDMMSGLICPK